MSWQYPSAHNLTPFLKFLWTVSTHSSKTHLPMALKEVKYHTLVIGSYNNTLTQGLILVLWANFTKHFICNKKIEQFFLLKSS